MPMLYEATSPRNDNAIWALTYGEPSRTPFYFNWQGKTSGGEYLDFDIDTSCHVIVTIKERLSDEEAILEYTIQMQPHNTIMLELSQEDMLKLKANKTYHTSISLYDANDKLIRVLLRDLPTKILGSGV